MIGLIDLELYIHTHAPRTNIRRNIDSTVNKLFVFIYVLVRSFV